MSSYLQQLQCEWYAKLKMSGFKDIEDANGELKDHSHRTISFEDWEAIMSFITELGHFIENDPKIPELHIKILTLYCKGIHIKEIASQVDRVSWTVSHIIKIYRDQILRE